MYRNHISMTLFVTFWGRGLYSVCMSVHSSIPHSPLSDVPGLSLRSPLSREPVTNLAARIHWEQLHRNYFQQSPHSQRRYSPSSLPGTWNRESDKHLPGYQNCGRSWRQSDHVRRQKTKLKNNKRLGFIFQANFFSWKGKFSNNIIFFCWYRFECFVRILY